MTKQQFQPTPFAVCNAFPHNPTPGLPIVLNGTVFFFLEVAPETFKWVPFMHASEHVEHEQTIASTIWTIRHAFDPVTNVTVLVEGEAVTAPIDFKTDAEGAFVEIDLGSPTTGTAIVVGYPESSKPIDYRPAVAPSALTLNDGATVNIDVNLTQAFPYVGEGFTFSLTGLPTGLSFDGLTGLVSGTIHSSASQARTEGRYPLILSAHNGQGERREHRFTWTVVNTVPVAVDDVLTVNIGQVADVPAGSGLLSNDSDGDNDNIVITSVRTTGGPTAYPVIADGVNIAGNNGGRFTLFPSGHYQFDDNGDFSHLAEGESAETRITYTVEDADGVESSATLTVTVNNPVVAIVETTLVWTGYSLPPEINDEYVPGEDYQITAPAYALSDAGDVLVLLNAYQEMGSHVGTADVPLFKVKQLVSDVWEERTVFFPSAVIPRGTFDTAGIDISPDGQWIAVLGSDRDYRSIALMYKMVEGVPTYRQALVLDVDQLVEAENPDHTLFSTVEYLEQDLATVQTRINNGELSVGDRIRIQGTGGSLAYAPERAVQVGQDFNIVVTAKNGSGDYELFVNGSEFFASECHSLSNNTMVMGHLFTSVIGDPTTRQMRNGIFKLDQSGEWSHHSTIVAGRDVTKHDFVASTGHRAISADGQHVFLHDGDVVGQVWSESGNVANICQYTLNGASYQLTNKIQIDSATAEALDLESRDMGWSFDVSADGETIIALDDNSRLYLWKYLNDSWTLTCVSHASDTSIRNDRPIQSIPPMEYQMTAAIPVPLLPVDGPVNSWFERRVAITADGQQIIVAGLYDNTAPTAFLLDVDVNGKMSYNSMLDDYPNLSDIELGNQSSMHRICVGAGGSSRVIGTYSVDETHTTNGSSLSRR